MTVPLFPGQRRQIVVGGVQASLVVPGDPTEDRGSRLGAGAVVVAVDQLDLEGGEEGLGDGVIQARPGAAIDRRSPSPSQTSMQAVEGVFAAAVAVEQPPHQVGRGWGGGVRLGQTTSAAGTVPDDAVDSHQPLHPLCGSPSNPPA
jgi:hypothetical protein